MDSRYRTDSVTDFYENSEAAGVGRTYCVMAMPREAPPAVPAGRVRQTRQSRQEQERPHREERGRGSVLRVAAGLLLAAVVISSPAWLTSERLLPVMKRLSAASAAMELPEENAPSASDAVETLPQQTAAPSSTATTTAPTTASTAAQSDTDARQEEGLLPVSEQQVKGSGTKVKNIYVKNSTGYSPDFEKLLASSADCRIKLNAKPQVLIVHTHTTEGYAQRADGLYSPDYSPRTTDSSRNMLAVGEVLARKLEQAGIGTIHATETHDHPKYNGSYERALETVSKYLEQYPSIEMVLDVHRDAITYDDGTKLKPTVSIDGRKAAQVMIISGCDAGGKLYFPGWKNNLCMALQIQSAAEQLHPGLMRPLNFAPYRYNMHMTPNSLLLEFGTDANTLEEALFSAELMGDALVDVLLKYDVDKK